VIEAKHNKMETTTRDLMINSNQSSTKGIINDGMLAPLMPPIEMSNNGKLQLRVVILPHLGKVMITKKKTNIYIYIYIYIFIYNKINM
jgi:hypothetical protein